MIPPRSPLTQQELPTNDPSIALGNLDGELEGGRQMLRQNPKNPIGMAALAQSLLQHGAVYGKLSEYDEAEALVEQAVKLGPRLPNVWVAHAAVRSRFHKFNEALADLVTAEKLGFKGRDLDLRRASLLQAQGHLAEARALREKWVKQLATFETLYGLATLDADEGNLDEAERAFIVAEQQFRDVSPFAIAALWLQEATMWQNAGRQARARELLEAAHERVPVDAAITSHLAVALAATGERDKAVALLRPLVASSDDPEHAGLLSDLLLQAGASDEAKALRERADARYQQLLKAHPDAFGDHAARFYLGAGAQPQKAVPLARANLKLRQTAEAFGLVVDAELASGNAAGACSTVAQAVTAFPRFPQLHVLAWKAYQACGQKDKAEAELKASQSPPAPPAP